MSITSISCIQLKQSFLEFFRKHNHTILPSSSLVPSGDNSLLFVNSGMVQFKNYFTGVAKSQYDKVSTAQKCLRVGGKHNDIEQIGFTKRHHTFFEMLGNFSFGGYFKEQAIYFAWDFLTNVIKLDKSKLYVTVHEQDDEAVALWSKFVTTDRIYRMKNNFWSMGDTGPCGPCSEIFYDLGSHLDGSIVEDYGDRYLEIWNLVFMSYEQIQLHGQSSMIELQTKCVDTGIGLERLTAVLNGLDDTFSLNEFSGLIMHIAQRLKLDRREALHMPACKILADHTRSIAFLLAEGLMPGNEGREYVVRKLIRRCARFIYSLTSSNGTYTNDSLNLLGELIQIFGEQTDYIEVMHNMPFIQNILKEEMERFGKVLANGMDKLTGILNNSRDIGIISGTDAFDLYQTYGFPLEISKDLAKEHNLTVNEEEYCKAQEHHREIAQASWKGKYGIEYSLEGIAKTEFVGYELNSCEAKVLNIIKDGLCVNAAKYGEEVFIILDKTPFYGEGGGQIGDTGTLISLNDCTRTEHTVLDTSITDGIYMHKVCTSAEITIGSKIYSEVDIKRRQNIRRCHSATHLLNSALRTVLGTHVSQKGSLVTDDKLRFDFTNPKAMTKAELLQVERIVNSIIAESIPVKTVLKKYREAINDGAITCPGEGYPEEVRVIEMRRMCSLNSDSHNNCNPENILSLSANLVSSELCCGTHVANTSDIGCFKIIKESSVGAYTRRIEAVCGINAYEYMSRHVSQLDEVCELVGSASYDQLSDKIKRLVAKSTGNTTASAKAQNIIEKLHEFTLNTVAGLAISVDLDSSFSGDQITEILQKVSRKHSSIPLLIIFLKTCDSTRLLCKITSDIKTHIDIKEIAEQLRNLGAKCGGNDMQIHGSIKDIDIEDFIANLVKKTMSL